MRKFTLLVVAALFAATPSFADTAADVEKRIKENYPASKITSVRESHVKGVYEVAMGRNVAYTDVSGRYMIFGHLYDMKEQKDLTASVLEELNKIDVSGLPVADAIQIVRGNGKRKLYVFSDPDCPFCKKLESNLAQLDNVTIYTFLYPLESLHPDAKRKARAIWCAKDRSKAWDGFMANGKLPEKAACDDSAIDRNIRLGTSLGINGTPTIIFGNGRVVPGAIPAEQIEYGLGGEKDQAVKTVTGG